MSVTKLQTSLQTNPMLAGHIVSDLNTPGPAFLDELFDDVTCWFRGAHDAGRVDGLVRTPVASS
jgi:hypothetical protein